MKKILIVEDDHMLVEIYQKKFSEGGFEVETAATGTEAIAKIKKTSPELVLLDLVMPEEDGFDVLRKIKKDEKTRGIHVVVFSNLSQQEDKKRAEALGAEGFITKSDYTPQQLVDEVNRLLDVFSKAGSAEKTDGVNQSDFQEENQKKSKAKAKILLVEDEEAFIDVFGKKLENEGYQVDLAKNGMWGLKQVAGNNYDILIVDILMPALDGLKMIEKIKQEKGVEKIPIVVFSNSVDEDEARKQALEHGADLFFIKTRLTPSELADHVKELLKKYERD